jgi:F0F1-type ATP synthase epsilon subunit
VLVNKDILESWGKKVREVELQTKKGRITICKAHPVSNLTPEIIQIPSKIKASLRIEDGAHVKVKPILK